MDRQYHATQSQASLNAGEDGNAVFACVFVGVSIFHKRSSVERQSEANLQIFYCSFLCHSGQLPDLLHFCVDTTPKSRGEARNEKERKLEKVVRLS